MKPCRRCAAEIVGRAAQARYCTERCRNLGNYPQIAAWQKANPEKVAAKRRRYYLAHADEIRAACRIKGKALYRRDPVAFSEKLKAVRAKKPDLYAAIKAAQKRRVRLATPKCLPAAERLIIREAYRASTLLSKKLGIRLDVDHVIPLKGVSVSGLHVPWNLRLTTARLNREKGRSCLSAG